MNRAPPARVNRARSTREPGGDRVRFTGAGGAATASGTRLPRGNRVTTLGCRTAVVRMLPTANEFDPNGTSASGFANYVRLSQAVEPFVLFDPPAPRPIPRKLCTLLEGSELRCRVPVVRSWHPGELDVRGRSDFSRFDPRPERPHFSNFGPPAER